MQWLIQNLEKISYLSFPERRPAIWQGYKRKEEAWPNLGRKAWSASLVLEKLSLYCYKVHRVLFHTVPNCTYCYKVNTVLFRTVPSCAVLLQSEHSVVSYSSKLCCASTILLTWMVHFISLGQPSLTGGIRDVFFCLIMIRFLWISVFLYICNLLRWKREEPFNFYFVYDQTQHKAPAPS